MDEPAGTITQLLSDLRKIDHPKEREKKLCELFELVKNQFYRRARARVANERPGHTLQPTVLVDDAFMNLIQDPQYQWENAAQFYQSAARVMRRVLIDHARERLAQRRGGGLRPQALDGNEELAQDREDERLVRLDDALNRLQETEPELYALVDLRYFGGWELQEIADQVLHVSYATVKRRWQMARALLHRELTEELDDS